ncbi:hypothetical protein FKW77_003831 [Venturia effusa]|uniref:Transcription factor domain-containing protein n=1 Tax=Venturia effusa TaxID=50376 RepID=A0A517KZ98_9PEZI|nr:hypothetical protein FKW77_003831 [Venturia effusa]
MSSLESASLRMILFPIFHARFDSVHKILHWPSFVASIDSLHSNEPDQGTQSSVAVLESAVSFAAVCTIADHESDKLLPISKDTLLARFRAATEQGLANSALLYQPDIALLQAFVIYLLGLGSEEESSFSAFDLEIRRRLWYYMGVLDSHTCLDRGTAPLMTAKDFRQPPINCNDEDLAPGLPLPQPSHQLTEMTFSVVTHEAVVNQRKLLEPPQNDEDERSHWARKVEMVNNFELRMRASYSTIDMENSAPIHQLIKLAADDMAMTAHLLLRRPPYKQDNHDVPQQDGFDILGAATEVLVRDLRLRIPALAQWAWKSWVKWYALAIVLAELCSRPNGPQADKAFTVAQDAYEAYAPRIADSQSGMLWKPIVQLMRRVQRERSGLSHQHPSICMPSAPFDHGFGFDNAYSHEFLANDSLLVQEAFSDVSTQDLFPASNPGWKPFVEGSAAVINKGELRLDESWTCWERLLDEMSQPMEHSWAIL